MFLEIAHKLADSADRIALQYFRQPDLHGIDDKAKTAQEWDPVTLADRAIEQEIRQIIMGLLPEHGIIGEEFGIYAPEADKTPRYQWILDPIDGTRGFAMGLPIWACLIGLLENGKPIASIISQPFLRERFYNDDNHAFLHAYGCNPRQLQTRKTVHCLEEAMICSDTHRHGDFALAEHLMKKVRYIRNGTDCYGFLSLAMGQCDLVIDYGLQPYDILPLVALIEKAGGIVTNWQGSTDLSGGYILAAANPELHQQAIALLAQ